MRAVAEAAVVPSLMIQENAHDEALGTYHSIRPWIEK